MVLHASYGRNTYTYCGGVLEDNLIEVFPLGGLMVPEDLVPFLLMVLMVLVVLGGLVDSLLTVPEGLVPLLLVVLEAPEVYLPGVPEV